MEQMVFQKMVDHNYSLGFDFENYHKTTQIINYTVTEK